jgi:A/G-specific adenine glycosylase
MLCFRIAIALIWRDGKLLIARRPPKTHLANFWEFPGGKCEEGETLEDGLVREVCEELGVEVKVTSAREVIEYVYPERKVRVYPFDCALLSGQPQALGCQEWKWVEPKHLSHYEFPPANAPLIEDLICASSIGRQ